ncbi:MAG: hypothetical protein AAFY81_02455, partial [Pseudomonadota bacterium]
TVLIPLGEPLEDAEDPNDETHNGYVALLIDRASDQVQAEAVAAHCGYAVHDLGTSSDPDLPKDCDLTLITDANLLAEVEEDLVIASQRIIVLGDNPAGQSDAAKGKTVFVSHTQLARSLSEILKGQAS